VEQFAKRIRELFPACPAERELQIAEHACRKYSGRIGRSAAARRSRRASRSGRAYSTPRNRLRRTASSGMGPHRCESAGQIPSR
jgi:hypothetical protein